MAHMPNGNVRGWLCVIGGVFIHLTIGTLYLWANITEAVTSHLRKYDPSITYNQTLLVYATALGFQGVSMILGSFLELENKIGARYCCLLGGYILVAGTFLSAFAQSLVEIIIFNGAMFGIGIGLCYAPPIACSGRWMPNRKGLVTGMIVAGFGAGSFFFGFLALALVNPEKLGVNAADGGGVGGEGKDYYDPDSSVPNNVPHMFFVLGTCYFFLITIGSLLLSEPPAAALRHETEEGASSAAKKQQLYTLTALREQPIERRLRDARQSFSSVQSEQKSVLDFGVQRAIHNALFGQSYQRGGTEVLLEQSNSGRSGSAEVDDALFLKGSRDRSNKHNSSNSMLSGSSVEDGVAAEDESRGVISAAATGSPVEEEVVEVSAEDDVNPNHLIRQPLAWHMAACFVTTTIGGIFLLGTFKVYGQQIFTSESFLSMLSSTAALFAAAGRVFWGTLSDRIGILKSLFVLSSILSVVILTYPLSAPMFGETGFAIWTYMIFFFTGGNFSLYMPLNMQIFGTKYAGPNYGIFFSCYSFSTFFNITFLAKENVSLVTASRAMGLLTLFGFLNLILFYRHLKSSVAFAHRS